MPDGTLVIEGYETHTEPWDLAGCQDSGMMLRCSAASNSVWNGLTSSSPLWRTIGYDSDDIDARGVFTSDQRSGQGLNSAQWSEPCTSTSGFSLRGERQSRKIWAPGGERHALFAISPPWQIGTSFWSNRSL